MSEIGESTSLLSPKGFITEESEGETSAGPKQSTKKKIAPLEESPNESKNKVEKNDFVLGKDQVEKNDFVLGKDQVEKNDFVLEKDEIIKGMEDLRREVRVSILQHQISKIYFEARQYKRFFLPQVFITLVSSILSFVATSFGSEGGDSRSWLTLIVGILALVVVALQTVGHECAYGERAVMHDAAIEGLRNLEMELDSSLAVYKLNSHSGNIKDINKDFVTRQKQFRQFQIGCKSAIPIEIRSAFDLLESEVLNTYSGRSAMGGTFDDFHKYAFQRLSSNFASYKWFPTQLPNAESICEDSRDGLENKLQILVVQQENAIDREQKRRRHEFEERMKKEEDKNEMDFTLMQLNTKKKGVDGGRGGSVGGTQDSER